MIGILSCFTLLVLCGGLQAWIQDPFPHCEGRSECPTVAIGGLPIGEELTNGFCPDALQNTACLNDATEECTGKTMAELAASNNQSVALYSSSLMSLRGLAVDFCNENSPLHKSYVESVECFNENAYKIPPCIVDAEGVYDHYKILATQNNNVVEADERRCLQHAYTTACITAAAVHSCGNTAKSLFMEVLSRLPLMAVDECPATIGHVLKNEFLNSLGLNPLLKSTYSEVFDVIAP